jgi:multiple sugar transport system substrate-binding protein
MNCIKCGNTLEENSKFCTGCGEAVAAPQVSTPPLKKKNYFLPIIISVAAVLVFAGVGIGGFFVWNNRHNTPVWYDDSYYTQNDSRDEDEYENETEEFEPADITPAEYDEPKSDDAGLAEFVEEPETRDFGGRVLTIGAWWDTPIAEIALGSEPNRATSQNYALERAVWDNTRRVEREFNVRFETVTATYSDFMPMFTTRVLSGAHFADVVVMDGLMQLEAIRGNIIIPWDDASFPDSDVFGAQVYARPTTHHAGRVWAINPHGANAADAYGLGVNLDIIYADGLPNPVELFESGLWTWDVMLDLMRAVTRDTNNSGTINQFGIAGVPGEIIMHLIGSNDGILVDADLNYGLAHPNTMLALEFAAQIFDERLWASEPGGIMNAGNWYHNFFSGYEYGNVAFFPMVTWGLSVMPPPFEYAFVPFPTGPNNRTGNTWLSGYEQGICIVSNTEWDAEDILFLLEELFSWHGGRTDLLQGSTQIEWIRENYLTEDDVQRVLFANNTAAVCVGRSTRTYDLMFNEMATAFYNGEMTAVQAIEHFRAPSQEILDRAYR